MIKNKKILIAGGGGFIGGHLVKKLMKYNDVISVDIKPNRTWYQYFNNVKNFRLDLKDYKNCLKATKNVDFVFNMACNMGGMGFIENNKAECMISVLINTNLLRASVKNKVSRYFFLHLPVHIIFPSREIILLKDLRKAMHILPIQRMGMDGKNYLAKECVRILKKIFD